MGETLKGFLNVVGHGEVDSAIGKRALVIGAGGISPSVIFSLQKSGIKNISIINRTIEKCIFLQNKFKNLNILKWENIQDEIKNFETGLN